MEQILATHGRNVCRIPHDIRVGILDRYGTIAETAPASCLAVGDRFTLPGSPGVAWLATNSQQLRDSSNV